MAPIMFDRLDQIEAKYNELTHALASPEIVSDSARYQKTAKAHSEISDIVLKYREYKDLKQGVEESRAMVAEESDAEMKRLRAAGTPATRRAHHRRTGRTKALADPQGS